MRAIFLSRDRLKLSIASAVGCRITRQRFLSKYALASGDNRTFPSWPAPTINTSQPSSKTNFASSFETMWEVPYFSFERRFRRFSTLPERRMITSCSEVFASIVTAPNSVASIRIVFSRIASERRRFLGYGRGPQDSQRMGQRRDDPIRLAPIEFLLPQAEYSSRHSQRVAGQRWGQVGRNEGCEFHRLAFVGRLSRNAPAVVEDPSHEKRELRPQVHGLFRRQAIAQDVQHRSQRPVGVMPVFDMHLLGERLEPDVGLLDRVIERRYLCVGHDLILRFASSHHARLVEGRPPTLRPLGAQAF